jgi:hypothetical protein
MAQSFVGMITDARAALAYMFGGKATVTLRSLSSGTRYTFKLVAPRAEKEALKAGKCDHFNVSFLFGQDNVNDYRYLGQVRGNKFSLTPASRNAGYNEQTPAYIAFQYAFSKLVADIPPADAKFEVWHEGKCGRCGRKLTVPESISTGFGPECVTMVSAATVSSAMLATEAQEAVVAVGGAAAPQPKLNFDGSTRQERIRRQAEQRGRMPFGTGHGVLGGTAVAQAVLAPAAPVKSSVERVDNLDAAIRAKIEDYKREAPENYFQDGMLDDKEAFKVAYNKFRVELSK